MFSSVEFNQTSGPCRIESSRMPTPAYSRVASVPVSQNIAPLAGLSSPPIRFVGSSPSKVVVSLRDAMKFTLPAPAPIRPASRMYVAPA